MDEIRRQADGRLQTVLTPEQWQQFQTVRDEMRQRRGGRGGPRHDRPAGFDPVRVQASACPLENSPLQAKA